jgi:hypothetical protein
MTSLLSILNFTLDTRHWIACLTIAAISVVFFILARFSNLLRDEISNAEEFAANAIKLQTNTKWKLVQSNAPFSLTKVQFGVWTVVIASAYIYLSLCVGDLNLETINKTALVLMGISAGTAVASTIMDKNEMSDNRPRHQNSPSQGFMIDILSDDNGISLHRFQNFTWTLIAIIVYLYKLSGSAASAILPELSDTLLALTGISSVTYLALKTKENDPPAVKPQDSTTAPAATVSTQAAA